MNIFIYGSDSFKKEINQVLEKGNVKFRLDESGAIEVVDTLSELKMRIEENPEDIFLIDDAKIIRKNILNEKIKFLKPKDGIEEEFLKENGIEDIKVDSYDDLSKHINKKLESMHLNDIFDEDEENVRDSIIDIVDEAYSEDEESTDNELDLGELDDELSSLLTHDESENDEKDDEIVAPISDMQEFAIDDGYKEDLIEDFEVQNSSFDEDLDLNLGESDMSEDFSELDNLLESDILAALDDIDVESFEATAPKVNTQSSSISSTNGKSSGSFDLSGSNVSDLTQLLKELLSNKTLEITIKIKD